MTWIRIDDDLHSHPKIQAAWHQSEVSVGLHLLALSHSACYLTDGHVSRAFVALQLPNTTVRKQAVDALVASELWVVNGTGWEIHDYLDYNDSREKILARRAAEAERKATRRQKVSR
ncbi:MAG: hypothetical protein WBP81_29235 [Solirubrobacteraceae bacterium]